MRYIRLLVLVLAIGTLLLNIPSAFALSGSVALPFTATYTAPDGTACTHRGVDVEMDAGDAVTSPVKGSVSFAGRIPGPHGGSVLAVTIAAGDSKVTLMPLAELNVAKGQAVDSGEDLGTCANGGDPSSAGAHIHVSQRRGDVYVDPVALVMAPPAPEPQSQTSTSVEGAEAPEPSSTPAEGVTPVVSASTPVPAVSPSAVTASRAGSSNAVSSGTHSMASSTQGSISIATRAATSRQASAAGSAVGSANSVSAEIAPGVTLAPSTAVGAPSAALPSVRMASPITSALRATASVAQPAVHFATGHLPLAIGVVAAAVLGAISLITRRALTHRFVGEKRVSDRLGIMLQRLNTGDTLCRLTSCSGPLPSQSRGQ